MKRKDILMLLIPTFIFVIAWVGFSIWHNVVSTTISEVLNIQISPIAPTFDTQTVANLKKRSVLTPIFESDPTLITDDQLTPTPTPEIVIPATSSESAQASSGGILSQ